MSAAVSEVQRLLSALRLEGSRRKPTRGPSLSAAGEEHWGARCSHRGMMTRAAAGRGGWPRPSRKGRGPGVVSRGDARGWTTRSKPCSRGQLWRRWGFRGKSLIMIFSSTTETSFLSLSERSGPPGEHAEPPRLRPAPARGPWGALRS